MSHSSFVSSVQVNSAQFSENAAHMQQQVDDLRATVAAQALGGSESARAKHAGRGKLLVRDRIDALLDPGSAFLEIGQLAALHICMIMKCHVPVLSRVLVGSVVLYV